MSEPSLGSFKLNGGHGGAVVTAAMFPEMFVSRRAEVAIEVP